MIDILDCFMIFYRRIRIGTPAKATFNNISSHSRHTPKSHRCASCKAFIGNDNGYIARGIGPLVSVDGSG